MKAALVISVLLCSIVAFASAADTSKAATRQAMNGTNMKASSPVVSKNNNGRNVAPWVKACGSLAPVASVALFMAPIPTVQKIVRDRSVGKLPLLPYSTMVSNCFVWTVYGEVRSRVYDAS